jgi:hypothetical protein
MGSSGAPPTMTETLKSFPEDALPVPPEALDAQAVRPSTDPAAMIAAARFRALRDSFTSDAALSIWEYLVRLISDLTRRAEYFVAISSINLALLSGR